MRDMITLCGDNCAECPRHNARSEEELERVAELWYRVGWRDTVVSADDMRCGGCSSHKQCTYRLVECVGEHHADSCGRCDEFPCAKIEDMLARSKMYEDRCKEVCTKREFESLSKAFFNKENNLKNQKIGR